MVRTASQNDAGFGGWLGNDIEEDNINEYYGGGTTQNAAYNQQPTNPVVENTINVARNVLFGGTREASSRQSTDTENTATMGNWQSFKHRLANQAELKWALIILAIALIVGLGGLLIILFSARKRNRNDQVRFDKMIKEAEKTQLTMDQVKTLSTPATISATLTADTLLQKMPSLPGPLWGTAMQGVGKQIILDYQEATDETTDLPVASRQAKLLAAQSKLAFMDGLAVGPLISKLCGFEVIDMKLRINTALGNLQT